MENEAELCALLRAEGVEIIVPSLHSLEDQVRMFANAKAVIGPHGAGLKNIIFCEPGATVYELIRDATVRTCYATLAQSMDMHYWAEAFPVHMDSENRQGWAWTASLRDVLDAAHSLLELPPLPRPHDDVLYETGLVRRAN